MRAVVAPAALRFQRACPGVALTLRSAAFAAGVRLLADGAGDRHRGGIDDGRALPAFLRREPLLQITAGIVAHRGHPLHGARPTPGYLLRHPWLECYASALLPALDLKPLPLTLGRRRCRTGLVARRSAENLGPVRLFEDIVRTIALEHPG